MKEFGLLGWVILPQLRKWRLLKPDAITRAVWALSDWTRQQGCKPLFIREIYTIYSKPKAWHFTIAVDTDANADRLRPLLRVAGQDILRDAGMADSEGELAEFDTASQEEVDRDCEGRWHYYFK